MGVFEGVPVVGGRGVAVLKGGRFFATLRMTEKRAQNDTEALRMVRGGVRIGREGRWGWHGGVRNNRGRSGWQEGCRW